MENGPLEDHRPRKCPRQTVEQPQSDVHASTELGLGITDAPSCRYAYETPEELLSAAKKECWDVDRARKVYSIMEQAAAAAKEQGLFRVSPLNVYSPRQCSSTQ